jgi:hypothetical protein
LSGARGEDPRAVDGQRMRARAGRCPIAGMHGEAKADGPVWLEVGCVPGDVVEDVGWMFVEAEDGRFEVDGGAEVVVLGQLVWVDEEVRGKGVEGMEGTGGRESREGETGEQGGVEARRRLQPTHPHMFPTAIRRWSTAATKPAKFGQPVFASHPHLGPPVLFLFLPAYPDPFSQSERMNSPQASLPASTRPGDRGSSKPSPTTPSSSSWVARSNT